MRILPPKCSRGGRCKIRKRVVMTSGRGKVLAFDLGRRRVCTKCGRLAS